MWCLSENAKKLLTHKEGLRNNEAQSECPCREVGCKSHLRNYSAFKCLVYHHHEPQQLQMFEVTLYSHIKRTRTLLSLLLTLRWSLSVLSLLSFGVICSVNFLVNCLLCYAFSLYYFVSLSWIVSAVPFSAVVSTSTNYLAFIIYFLCSFSDTLVKFPHVLLVLWRILDLLFTFPSMDFQILSNWKLDYSLTCW